MSGLQKQPFQTGAGLTTSKGAIQGIELVEKYTEKPKKT